MIHCSYDLQKLGEKLGQGSFGSVYRALNWTTGETVAVKQIGLANIPKSELPDIMVSFAELGRATAVLQLTTCTIAERN